MDEPIESLIPPEQEPLRKVLVVLRDEDRYNDLVGSGHERFDCFYHSTVGEAARAIASGEPPCAVLIDLVLSDCNGLELLGVLDTLGLRIPVLILVPGPRPVRVEQEHHFLTVLPEVSRETLPRTVADAVRRATVAPDRPMFRVLDYLRLALELKLSVHLRIHLDPGAELQLDVLGGDLWRAQCGEEGGLRMLANRTDEYPKRVRASHFQSLPSERLIFKSSAEILRFLTFGPAADGRAKARRASRETQPMDITGLVPARRDREDSVNLASAKEAPAQSATDERYKSAISRGIDAALRRNFTAALEAFEAALEIRPGDPQAHYNLRRIQQRLKS